MNQEVMQALPNQEIRTDESTSVILGLSLKLPYVDNVNPVVYNHSQVTVSSFGFGVNAHAILQRLPKRERLASDHSKLGSNEFTAQDLGISNEYQKEDIQVKKEVLLQQSIEKEFSPKIDEILQTRSPQVLDELREIIPVVVGYSACLPGCDDLNDFWQLLLTQQHVFSQTPANRLKYMQQHSGAFIWGVEEFDAAFFNLSPLEAKVMDPQQRLLLQKVWHALEMAGIKPQQLRGSATGVYVGASTFDYAKLLTRNNIDNPYIAVATVPSLLANRISHYFDLCGPSEAVDTACSSGLYALDRAVNAIKQGEVEQAIVCGVNLLLDDEFFHAFTQSGMLSATKLCKPFDKKADGYIRGEGIIVIILQKQTIAQEEKNTIYARILATAVNHTGKTNTLTSPSSKAQQQLYEKIYAKVDINRISYLEAHGTGMPIDDAIEIEGLKNCVGDKKLAIEVGSVKGNIGHLEPASGLAGLVKILLMFQHNIIPGQANLSEINPHLALDNSGLSINQQTHNWPQSIVAGKLVPRCAAINSFGFGGVNAHVVLEQAVEISNAKKTSFIPLMPLSAENQTSLQFLVKDYMVWLQKNEAISPATLCVTLQQRRFHHRFRILFQWQSKQQIIEDMQHWLNEPDTLKIATEYELIAQTYLAGKVAFSDEFFQQNALPVHPTPAYPFIKKKIWFETQKNQLIYVENFLVSNNKIKLKPLKRQCILWLYSACFYQAIALMSSELESNNRILRYPIDGFDIHEFANFLLNNEDIDRLIIYPEIAPFNLESSLRDNRLINSLQPLFELLKAAVKNRNFANKLVLDVYSYIPQNASSGLKHPQIAMIEGLLNSLGKEMPHWQIKHVDTDIPLELTMLHANFEGQHQTLNYRQGHYLTKSLTCSSCIDDEDFLQAKAVYLILGGMGRIGQHLTNYLIDHYQAKVILVGRHALDEVGSAFINARTDYVEFIQTDVTHAAECALLLKYLQLKYPTIDAVFNLVMGLQNKAVDSMSWEVFNEVIKVRLLSAYFIKQLHQQMKIKAAVIFSSMQSYGCFAGQANYADAAASCSLDAYCMQLSKLVGLNIKIINWSVWEEIDATAESFDLKELDFIPLTIHQAWEAMELGLNSQYKQFAVQNKIVAELTKQVSSPVKQSSTTLEKININCYQQIWSKKEATTIDLSHYQTIIVFLTHSQQEWVKQEFEQAGCAQGSIQIVHYILVDEAQDFERGLNCLEEQAYELIYYFAGMVEEELTTSSLLDSQKLGIKPFLTLLRKLHQSNYANKKLTLYIYSNNAYAFNDYSINPFAASLHGLAQTMKKEYPTWLIECIDIVPDSNSAHTLTISSLGQAYPLVLADNGVWDRQLEAVELSLAKYIFHDKVLVLIGGDGQIGKLLVAELSKDKPKAIIIASRHVPLRKEGIFYWRPLDCSDLVAVDLFIEEIISQYSKIDCIYHLGSHHAESPLVSLSFYDYLMQMCAKVLGSFHLIKTCEDKAVMQVVLTSSVQVYSQNKNRGAYSAACFYTDSVVAAMQSKKTKLIHWGFWQQENDDANKIMASVGILPITAKQGYHALQIVAGSSQSNFSFFNVSETVEL